MKRCRLRRRSVDVQGSGELGVYGGVERGHGADAGALILSVRPGSELTLVPGHPGRREGIL